MNPDLRSTLLWAVFASISFISTSQCHAEFAILVPVIVVEEISDPYYIATFSIVADPGTTIRGYDPSSATNDGITISGIPSPAVIIPGSTSVPNFWLTTNSTATSVTFGRFTTQDFVVPLNSPPVTVGTFSFQMFSPIEINFPPTFDITVVGHDAAGNSVTTTGTSPVLFRGIVPEPASYTLLGVGIAIVGWRGRKFRIAA
jgi:hypothetical protein